MPIVLACPRAHRHHPVFGGFQRACLIDRQAAQRDVKAVEFGHLAGNGLQRGSQVVHRRMRGELEGGRLPGGKLMLRQASVERVSHQLFPHRQRGAVIGLEESLLQLACCSVELLLRRLDGFLPVGQRQVTRHHAGCQGVCFPLAPDRLGCWCKVPNHQVIERPACGIAHLRFGGFGVRRQVGEQLVDAPHAAVPHARVGQRGKGLTSGGELVGVVAQQGLAPALGVKAGLQQRTLVAQRAIAALVAPGFELFQRVPQVVALAGAGVALGVKRVAVFFHLVKPHMLGARRGAAGEALFGVAPGVFAEQQDRGFDAGVGLEHATGQRDHALHHVLGEQLAAQAHMGIGVAKQHALRNDDGAAPAHLQQVEHQPQKQQLALVG